MTVESQQNSDQPATIVVQARRKWKVKDLKLEVSGVAREHDVLPPVLFWGTMLYSSCHTLRCILSRGQLCIVLQTG